MYALDNRLLFSLAGITYRHNFYKDYKPLVYCIVELPSIPGRDIYISTIVLVDIITLYLFNM